MPKLLRSRPRDRSYEEAMKDRDDANARKLKREQAKEKVKQELTTGTYNSLEDLMKLQVVNTLLITKIIDEGKVISTSDKFDTLSERDAAMHRTRIINLKDLLAVERSIRDLASRVAIDGVKHSTIDEEGMLALDAAELTLTNMGVPLAPPVFITSTVVVPDN